MGRLTVWVRRNSREFFRVWVMSKGVLMLFCHSAILSITSIFWLRSSLWTGMSLMIFRLIWSLFLKRRLRRMGLRISRWMIKRGRKDRRLCRRLRRSLKRFIRKVMSIKSRGNLREGKWLSWMGLIMRRRRFSKIRIS